MTKSTIMRKLLPLILFVVFAGSAYAQTVSFSVVTAPCNNNGILKAYFSASNCCLDNPGNKRSANNPYRCNQFIRYINILVRRASYYCRY